MSAFGGNSLQAPLVPKQADPELERAVREIVTKLVETQTLLRAAIEAIIKLGGSV